MPVLIRRWFLILAAACLIVLGYLFFFTPILSAKPKRVEGKTANLPLPSTFLPDRLPEFQKVLSDFLHKGEYRKLGWSEDKELRDTGPYINKKSHGVHPTVKIYYSPEVMKWLIDGRSGTIADGAIIIKEQYPPPAPVSVEGASARERLDGHDQGLQRFEGRLVLGGDLDRPDYR